MEISDPNPSSSESSGGSRRSASPHSVPNYGSRFVQDALEHLASIDLINLCNEAKIERCRATRDLSSCGRYVHHVLNACGHASLCEECSQRFDVCPICRTLIPNDGNRLRLRLFYECIEAGLISRIHDERFQKKEESGEHMLADNQRLYSLFDVALENNLVSLICHYVTDVCMDENAVSSDPVFAFLLDEVVVKNWCQQTFKSLVSGLSKIYMLGIDSMRSSLSRLQKFASHLAGVSNVLGVIASSFKNSHTAQLHDLHYLFENVLKTKQHLDVIIWCTRHNFLQDILPRFSNSAAWNEHVHKRKEAAVKRSWPDFLDHLADPGGCVNALFIEEALSNLGIENEEKMDEDMNISCLQDESLPFCFSSKIDDGNGSGCYPFHSLRTATDVLFLHGTSDMVVAKHAIFLYYLFDRHWTRPDADWKFLIDDFAASFDISRHSALESLVFYLLDDHSNEALEEASHLLPEICGIEAHPKIARVLLERQRPDMALNFLRCSGRDELCTYTNTDNYCSQNITLGEAVTAVRVRIECGLLTEAFMYQRMYYSEVEDKPKQSVNLKTSNIQRSDNWLHVVEVLVTEICHLCIRRNLIDRMIELPWNSTEEKYLKNCLLNYACKEPSSVHGSLLVVFYLQRYRYVEAYQVDHALQELEQDILENMNEDVFSKMQLISQWRAGLIEKCLELLPEIQRKKAMSGDITENGYCSLEDFQMSIAPDLCNGQPDFPAILNSPCLDSSVILQTKKVVPPKNSTVHVVRSTDITYSESGSKVPSVIQQKLHAYSGSPVSSMDAIHEISSPFSLNRVNPSNGSNIRDGIHRPDFKHSFQSLGSSLSGKFNLGTRTKPIKEMSNSIPRRFHNDDELPYENSSLNMNLVDVTLVTENSNMFNFHGFLNGSVHKERPTNSSSGNHNQPDSFLSGVESNINLQGYRRTPVKEQSLRGAPRWRSGDSSEEEEDPRSSSTINGGALSRGRHAGLSRR